MGGHDAVAQTQAFQWTDENGVVHFSALPPPPGTSAQAVTLKPMRPVGTVVAQSRIANVSPDDGLTSTEQAVQKRAELSRARIEASSYEEALAIECDHVRGVIDKLSLQEDIIVNDVAGEKYRVMESNERQERINAAQEFIRDNNCGG